MGQPRALARTPGVAAGLAAAAAMALTVGLAPVAAAGAAVRMTEPSENHYAFAPNAASAAAGSSVTWTNATDAPHTVRSDTGVFGSSTLNQNQAFSFAFTTPGTYRYHCSIRPYMTGTITVTAAGAAQPRVQGALGFLVAAAGAFGLRARRR